MAADSGVVQIHGKSYHTVAGRIAKFTLDYPEYSVITKLISADSDRVVMKAFIKHGKAILATGYAEEVRGSSNINKTSALENAETSAVGRALAFFGLAGTEIASADEVANAIGQQKGGEAVAYLIAHNVAWRTHEHSCMAIRDFCHTENYEAAWEAWNEIPEADRTALKVAPTKGGWMDKITKEGLAQGAKDDFDAERGVYKSIADKE